MVNAEKRAPYTIRSEGNHLRDIIIFKSNRNESPRSKINGILFKINSLCFFFQIITNFVNL